MMAAACRPRRRGNDLATTALLLVAAAAAVCGAAANVAMTAEQSALLARLQADPTVNLHVPQQQQQQQQYSSSAAAAAAARGGARKLTGITFPPLRSPDRPSIDSFSWPWAATMEDLVVKMAGYPLETHKVPTYDGFILNMYRIPHGKYRHTEKDVPKPVVLLQHGVTLSSNSFVMLNANESIAFVLADAGFDVFMSNSRGNTYSRGHRWLNQYGPNYWRFSMDELALVDLPAQIDKALALSGASKLAYVGHSQGCTLIYMLLADKPKYNDKVSVVAHVGPVAFIEFVRAPFLRAQPLIYSDQWLKNAPLGDFLAHRDLSPFIMPFCGYNHTLNEWCVQQLNGMFYGPSAVVPTADYWIVGTTWPSTVSSRNLEHWSQMDRDGQHKILKYNYGNDCANLLRGAGFPRNFHESCNMAMYGALEPPEYNLTKITAPQAFFVGSIDIMSTPEDVAMQQKVLSPDVPKFQYVYERYSHMDFVWDRNALWRTDLVDVMLRFAPGTYGSSRK